MRNKFTDILTKKNVLYNWCWISEKRHISIMFFLLLLLFQPFFIKELAIVYKFIYIVSYTLCFSFSFLFVNSFFKHNIRLNRFLFILVSFVVGPVLISIISSFFIVLSKFLLNPYLNIGFLSKEGIDKEQLFNEVLKIVFFVQFCFVFFVKRNMEDISMMVKKENLKNTTKIKYMFKRNSANILAQEELVISGLNKNEVLSFDSKNVLYIKSEGHYVKIFYYCMKSCSVKSKILRNSMKNIENDLTKAPSVVRVHKSYIVNLRNVKYVRITTSRSGLIGMSENGIKLPLSETYIASLMSYINLYYSGDIRLYLKNKNLPQYG